MPPERDREPGLDGRRLETLFTAGNWERLVEEARRFLALQPDHPGAHYSLAWALTELKKYDEAGEHVRFLLAHHPEAGDTHRAAAFWYRRRGRGRAARRHIREGLRLDPAAYGEEIRRRTGVVPPKPALYDRLTGYENLAYTADIWRVSRKK